MSGDHSARSLWRSFETIHAVTYFADESRQAAADAGCRGFWMGYFGFRAAPLGAVGPGTVIATFANFAPTMVERAVPDVWSFASPAALLEARRTSASAALRGASASVADVAPELLGPLRQVVESADRTGRPLFAANDDVPETDDPVESLWQCCTALREHRGDGHVAALAAEGLSGLDAHVLQAASGAVDAGALRSARGWSDEDWQQSVDDLGERGLLRGDGTMDALGVACKGRLEATTDQLAAVPWTTLGSEVGPVADRLRVVAAEVRAAGLMPFPNPIGLD